MIYAVNKRTKEHRVADDHAWGHGSYSLVHATPDGWIDWHGGECPLPDWQKVEIEYRDGCHDQGAADQWDIYWHDDGSYKDIIAYRPILGADAKPEPPAWDGEGEPVVGEWCRVAGEGGAVEVMCRGIEKTFCIRDTEGYLGVLSLEKLLPIRTDRERWTGAAMEAAECYDSAPLIRQYFEAIYDAGLARLPEE